MFWQRALLIMEISLSKLENILTMIREVEDALGSGALYLQVLLKMIGISYIAEFGAEICKDAGFGAVAGRLNFLEKSCCWRLAYRSFKI